MARTIHIDAAAFGDFPDPVPTLEAIDVTSPRKAVLVRASARRRLRAEAVQRCEVGLGVCDFALNLGYDRTRAKVGQADWTKLETLRDESRSWAWPATRAMNTMLVGGREAGKGREAWGEAVRISQMPRWEEEAAIPVGQG